jgi:AraC-like DNA-binding protein
MELPSLYPLGGANERLMNVLVDEISGVSAGVGNLHLPQPKDRRVARIVETILADPADRRTREDWSKIVSASSRTIDRIFMTETGMSFGAWKRQAVLLESMRRLAAGQPVTTVAFDVGYDSPSAFIAMFRRTFGITPSKFIG